VIPEVRQLARATASAFNGILTGLSAIRPTTISGALLPFKRDARGFIHFAGWVAAVPAGHQIYSVDVTAEGRLFAVVPADKDLPPEKGRPRTAKTFQVVIPPNFARGRTIEIAAVLRRGDISVKIGSCLFRSDPSGVEIANSTTDYRDSAARPRPPDFAPSVAGIIVTQNGEPLLRGLLDSILKFEGNTFRRIVIVDHGSNDDTLATIKKLQAILPIQMLVLNESSFAISNNAGARLCDEDVLVFLNNDILFTASVIKDLTSYLGPQTGLVGLRLDDARPMGVDQSETAPQHVGVHFWPRSNDLWPFESRWLTDRLESNCIAAQVPSVTAAFAAIENQLFQKLGGFDERYFYGWEDVDLGMKCLDARRNNLSVNSAAAVHLRGQTRHRFSQAHSSRRRRNPEIFAADWEYSIRRAVVRDQFSRVGFWTGRNAHIAILSRPGNSRAIAIGSEIASHLPCKVFNCENFPEQSVSDVDALLILDSTADPTILSDLPMTAWVVGLTSHNWSIEELSRLGLIDFYISGTLSNTETGRIFVDELRRRARSGLRVLLRGEEALEPNVRSSLVIVAEELEGLGHTMRLAASRAPLGENRADAVIHFDLVQPPGYPKLINILWADSIDPTLGPDSGRYDAVFASKLPPENTRAPSFFGKAAERPAARLDSILRSLDRKKRRLN